MFYLLPFLVSFILTLIFTPQVIKLAKRLEIFDKPKPTKIHLSPVPLLGGLGIFISFAASVIFFWRIGWATDVRITGIQLASISIGGLILMIGGVLDDKFNLKPLQQIIFPIIAIIVVLFGGIKIQYVTNPFGGILGFGSMIGTVLAFFWLLGMIYTTKLLDGLDGLASGITVIGSLIIFLVSLSWDVPNSATSVLALILAGSVFGFLFFNWHPAKIFLGEGGSVFCGFVLGILAIISGSKIATALLIMGIPVLDVVWVIIRRILFGQKVTQGDQKHLHYRLIDAGLSHRQTVIFLYFLTAAFGLSSIFLASSGKLLALSVLLIFMIVLFSILFFIYKSKKSRYEI